MSDCDGQQVEAAAGCAQAARGSARIARTSMTRRQRRAGGGSGGESLVTLFTSVRHSGR